MVSEISRSNIPPPPPQPRSSHLAPGFRFHPTDEELVSYYLKRKVTGQRIRVDAVAEVDLYKVEPWDLPARSRLRSRDMEWYFFTSLDRKYSNRSRTNRATVEGYWKTTGKDRPVCCRSRSIGVKKTLVYHAGRAPRGQRTNWVMHEYRLEDEDLALAGIQQDGYVLCRVFQKSGPGPQNGAQYGAPFLEEEWERDDEEDTNFVAVNEDGDDALVDPASPSYFHVGDFLQNQELSIQNVDSVHLAAKSDEQEIGSNAEDPLAAKSDEQEIGSNAEDPSISVDDILKDQCFVDDVLGDADFVTLQDVTFFSKLKEENDAECQSNVVSSQNNACMPLDDICFVGNTSCISNEYPTSFPFKRENDQLGVAEKCNVAPEKHVVGNTLDTGGGKQVDLHEKFPDMQNDMDLKPSNPLFHAPKYSSSQLVDNSMSFYEALDDDNSFLNGFTNETSLLPITDFDGVDDFIAYYDAMDNLHYTPDSCQPQFMPVHPSSKVVGDGASSHIQGDAQESSNMYPSLVVACNGPSSVFHRNLTTAVELKGHRDKKLTKRLASFLGSIPAPPAFADEPSLIRKSAQISTSSSSFHVAAGVIQIENMKALGCSENRMLQKHEKTHFLVSYCVDGSLIRKSLSDESTTTLNFGLLSSFFRAGFSLLSLSALMLVFSYKVGVFVCNL